MVLALELDHELLLKPLERPWRCVVFQLELVVHLVRVHLFQGKADSRYCLEAHVFASWNGSWKRYSVELS